MRRAQRAAASAEPSPAYLTLAELGRIDPRLALSAADCAALEPLAAAWFDRGVDADYLTRPSPPGFPGCRLPRRPRTPPPHRQDPAARTHRPRAARTGTPVHRVMLECTECGTPGRPEALPDGLCRPCRLPDADAAPEVPVGRPSEEDVRAFTAGLRDLLKSP